MAKGTVSLPKKETKSTGSPSTLHPSYFVMISEAISTLKDRTGSSQQAIAKFMEDKYENVLTPNFKKVLSVQLKKFVKSERLVKVKNSFKISSTEKLKLAIKETQKKKTTDDNNKRKKAALSPKEKAAKKVTGKGVKTKRLSQVKTPEGFKRAKKAAKKPVSVAKTKPLSQVKTPEGLKKKKNLTPTKRKNPNAANSSRPAKKARK